MRHRSSRAERTASRKNAVTCGRPISAKRWLVTTALCAVTMAWGENDQSGTIEEVVVTAPKTGSRIARQADSPSPLSSYEGDDLLDAGLKDIRDLVGVLSINAGAENNSDNLTQNFTVGTANINLRGLGVASTLVLLNGRRQVLSSVQTDDGSSFVDLAALVPMLAIERVEILKDGATAIYGSEAVAGVANFITRQGFEGIEVQAEYRTRVSDGSQDDLVLDAVIGGNAGAADFLLAASHLDRSSLVLIEVDWLRPATSGFGNPGSFNVPSLGRTVADPQCERYAGLLQELTGGGTICRFDYGPQITAVPNEQRTQAWGRVDLELNETADLWAEFGYARNDISRDVSPSFPVLNTPLVPANNPGNTFGEAVFFQGRPFGFGHPPEINYYQHDTARLALGAEGRFSETDRLERLARSRRQRLAAEPPGRDRRELPGRPAGLRWRRLRYQSNCARSPPSPARAVACSSTHSVRTSPHRPETRCTTPPNCATSSSATTSATASRRSPRWKPTSRGFFPATGRGSRPAPSTRDQSLTFAYDTVTRQDGFAFLIGNANFEAADDVFAAYGEVWMPVSTRLEATGALRYENYGEGVGDTLDPKLTVLFRATDSLSVRGSFSTSFRAPSPFQTRGVQTNFTNIVDHDGSRTFAGRRTLGDPQLQPETSRAYNGGLSWRTGNWALNADLWRYSFEDVLRKENAQAIVNADPFDPRVERTSAGTVAIVNVAFINADRIETTGLDLSARADFATARGTLSAWAEATWLLAYDVTNAGVEIDGLGKLNRANVGAPNQRLRFAGGLSWTRERIRLNAMLRHVGAYEDDGGGDIDGFSTLDANASWSVGTWQGAETSLTVGAANLLDADPPHVNIAGSYDPRSADPRGRRVFTDVRVQATR